MDRLVLSLHDLAVESFAASSEELVIGDHHTGCIPGDCPASAVTDCFC